MKAPRIVLSLCLAMLATAGTESAIRAAGPEDSVVKVTSILQLPNPVRPWTKQNPMEAGGTGVVIDGKWILTVAHLVTYAEEIYVQPGKGGDRVEAKVAAIGPGIDLAVLKLEGGTFFVRRPPIPQASKLPEITSRVAVLGFPAGGTTLSTTQGTVARIEFDTYETGAAGLRIQVDAAIKPGNSGGPAAVDGKMIGIVSGHAENIGYIIPNQ